MTGAASRPHGADLRAFRWGLHPYERKLDGALEAARVALALLQRQERRLDELVAHWREHEARQQHIASECVRRDPRMAPHVLGYLGSVQEELAAAAERRDGLQRQLATARADCTERQRQLACLHSVRAAAERLHAQEQLRREARSADAAWLARLQQGRADARQGRQEAP